MQLTEGIKANFETLKTAAAANDLALMDCFDEVTGESIAAVCAVNRLDNGEFEFVPLAIMPYQPLYDRLAPPDATGTGYVNTLTNSEGGEAD